MVKNSYSIKFTFALVFAVLLISAVFALHVVKYSNGTTSANVNQNANTFYNISVNSSDLDVTTNMSQVNITFPSSISFVANTNGTDAPVVTFTNTSTVLSWTNTSGLVMNATVKYFWFNATASTAGNFNITVTTTNLTGSINTNLSVVVNDTQGPAVNLIAPTNNTFANVSTIYYYSNFTDNVALTNSTLILYYTNGTIVGRNTTIVSGTGNFSNLSFVFPQQGTFLWNYQVNDSAGNLGYNSSNYTITFDNVGPTVSLSASDATETSITISVSSNDSTSGVNGSCTLSSSSGSASGSVVTGLACGYSYTITATCIDYAGNIGTGSGGFFTSGCPGNGAAGGSSSNSWTTKGTISTTDLGSSSGANISLAVNERMSFVAAQETHYIGVKTLSGTSVGIQIASNTINATLNVGETQKYDLNNDKTYDLSINLSSIKLSKANLIIKQISEPVPQPVVSNVTQTGSTNNNTNVSAPSPSASSSNSWMIIIIVIVVVIIAVGIWLFVAYGKHKKFN